MVACTHLLSNNALRPFAACSHVLGDKDTFGFAFAAARKLHQLHAVPLPPGAALRYELSGQPWQQQGKWHFNGMMQYDHLVSCRCNSSGARPAA